MRAPGAEPARPRAPVASGLGTLDGLPESVDLADGGPQVGLVRLISQYLAVAEVHELQQAGHPAERQPDDDSVEAHLEHRAGLVLGTRGGAGLVVNDADLAARGHVKPVDVAAQPQPRL